MLTDSNTDCWIMLLHRSSKMLHQKVFMFKRKVTSRKHRGFLNCTLAFFRIHRTRTCFNKDVLDEYSEYSCIFQNLQSHFWRIHIHLLKKFQIQNKVSLKELIEVLFKMRKCVYWSLLKKREILNQKWKPLR